MNLDEQIGLARSPDADAREKKRDEVRDADETRYNALDNGIKMRLTLHEYRWMSNEAKATLEQDECEPEF